MSKNTAAGEEQVVVFRLAGQEYAVNISYINKIIQTGEITAVPHAPAYLEGIINFRGAVMPVVDLARLFNLPAAEKNVESKIMIIDTGGYSMGVLVDAVLEVLRVPAEKLEPAPELSGNIDISFIQGIALVDERLIILLDLNRVLHEQKKNILEILDRDLPTS